MANESLVVAYTSQSSQFGVSNWVRIEQIMPDEGKRYANVADVYALWLAAATGKSARKIRPDGCPVEFDGDKIIAYLGFYIWPSSPSLKFSIYSTMGKIGPRRAASVRREFSAFIDNKNRYALPYYMTGISVTWETPTFNSFGEQINHPRVTVENGIWLVFSESVFGAIRVKGTANGKAIILELEFTKRAEEVDLDEGDIYDWHTGAGDGIILDIPPDGKYIGDYIDNVKIAIMVTYHGGGDYLEDEDVEDTNIVVDQFDVTLPQCLKDVLSYCPDPFAATSIFCDQNPDKIVFINGCTGEVMGEKEGKSSTNFCTRVEDPVPGESPNTWLPGGE